MSIIRLDAPKWAFVVYITMIIVFFIPIVYTTVEWINAKQTGDAVTAIVYDKRTIKSDTSGGRHRYSPAPCVQYTHNGKEFTEWLDGRDMAVVIVDSKATLYVNKITSEVIFDPWRWPFSFVFLAISGMLLLPFVLKDPLSRLKPRLFKNAALMILFTILLTSPLNVTAAGPLEATSQSINVQGLPEPEISGIDTKTNTVNLAKPDFELTERTDLRAVVVLADAENVHLQTKEVKVSDTAQIRVALNTEIKKGYHITAKYTNHGIDGSGTSTVNARELEATPPSDAGPSGSGSRRVEAHYIVKEATPETVVVEKLVEAIQPPIYIKGEDILINGMPEPETVEPQEALDEPTPQVKAEPIALNPVVPEAPAKLGDGMSNTSKSVLLVSLLILCALMIPILVIILRVYNAHTATEPAWEPYSDEE